MVKLEDKDFDNCKGELTLHLGDGEITKCCPYTQKDFGEKTCEYLGELVFIKGNPRKRCKYTRRLLTKS